MLRQKFAIFNDPTWQRWPNPILPCRKRLGDCSDTLEITHLTHVLCQHYVFWDQLLTFALPYSPSLS